VVKLKLPPAVKHHATRMYGSVEVKLHTFVTSALDGAWACPSGKHPPLFNKKEADLSCYVCVRIATDFCPSTLITKALE
jgi:hypothetical protein